MRIHAGPDPDPQPWKHMKVHFDIPPPLPTRGCWTRTLTSESMTARTPSATSFSKIPLNGYSGYNSILYK